MSIPNLIINDVVIPQLATVSDLTQSYSPITSVARHRMGDGTLFTQTFWRKTATRIQGSGWIPAGLEAIDWDSSITIACIQPLAIQSASNVIALPAARRTDHAPWGFAIVGNNLIETPLAIVGDVATATAVPGATAYRVNYYPVLVCAADKPSEDFDRSRAVYSWSLEAEEV